MPLSIREDIWVKATKPFVEVYILRAYANNEAKIFHFVKYRIFFFFFQIKKSREDGKSTVGFGHIELLQAGFFLITWLLFWILSCSKP